MLFTSLIFIICYLPVILILYYTILRKNRKLQNIFLLIASLIFYAWGEPKNVFILMMSIVANWLFGKAVARHRENQTHSRWIIFAMVAFNLGILYVFKYLMFTVENTNRFFGTDFTVSKIILPIGISFFTFQAISYVIDVYRGKGHVQKDLINVGLYISFFPALVAGPIIRYETIEDQIMNRKENLDNFSEGVCRFMVGFGKKILLANNFAVIADRAFIMSGDELSVSFAWLGAIAYTLQIYFDFSGYSDMAIGLGKMFGFKLLENFNYPYISKSISEFWRRWHISLGSWFRDYVYFPLGGSRVKSKRRMILNLFIVWALTGFWHGANWTFICWGLMYFVLISFEKLTNFEKLGGDSKTGNFLKRIYTMLWVIIGWVFFRATDISSGFDYLKTMLFMNGSPIFDELTAVYINENLVFLLMGIVFSMPIAKAIPKRYNHFSGYMGSPTGTLVSFAYILGFVFLFLLSMSYLIKGSYNPFIYFNF